MVTDRVQNGELYMPMNSSEHPVNVLTGSHTDPATHTPAYKETAVKMQVLNEKGDDGWLIANAIIVVSMDDGK